MIIVKDKSLCAGCSACANICPKKCIKMLADERGFFYPFVNEVECVQCGQCDKICPFLNSKEVRADKNAYAAYFKDETVRGVCSSGGLFGGLAEEILNENGVVFGSAFADDFKSIKHVGIERKEDLPKLYGSKYLQSVIEDSYKSVEHFLSEDRSVMFVGTSCQISGLKSYLRKDYAKLLTVDVICHGVPSPLIWSDYVTEKEDAKEEKVIGVHFRNKRFGWSKSGIVLLFADGSEYCKTGSKDLYMRGFLSNLYLRESCYRCKCKGTHDLSDITLGDFWGIERVLPDFSDNKGVSAVILNTEKGKVFFRKIESRLIAEKVTYDDVLNGNPSLVYSAAKPDKSERFWNIYRKQGLIRAYHVCLKDTFIRRCYGFVRRVYGKIKTIIQKK